jgi:nitroreductase
MDCLEAISTRRSVRKFTDAGVTDAEVETLLRAAMAAPSAGNQQIWRFVVVHDAETRARLAAATPYGAPMGRGTLGIVVLADTEAETFPGNWANDCAAATENLLLAAHATGLGACWLGVYPEGEREKAVGEILGVSGGLRPYCMIAIGHPEAPGPEVDRYKPEKVRVDRWAE